MFRYISRWPVTSAFHRFGHVEWWISNNCFDFFNCPCKNNNNNKFPEYWYELIDFLINISLFFLQIGEASTDSGYDTIKLQHQISGGSSVSSSVVSTNLIFGIFSLFGIFSPFLDSMSLVELKCIM